MSAIKCVSLQVNYGHACVSIYTNSRQALGGYLARKGVQREKTAAEKEVNEHIPHTKFNIKTTSCNRIIKKAFTKV